MFSACVNNSAKPIDQLVISHQSIDLTQAGASFSIQFRGKIDTDNLTGDVVDLDLFDTDPALIEALHSQDKYLVCYLSGGSWEDWRPDAGDYPDLVMGADYEGWPGERWVDIRQLELLKPIMEKRLDLCKVKGFDGVEVDNMDLHQNETGFTIAAADQLAFSIWFAEAAHMRGLSIGLKNNHDQASELLSYYDWALTEDCFVEDWCAAYQGFIEQDKPVFAIEYSDQDWDQGLVCAEAEDLGIYVLFKHRDLDASVDYCE